VMNDGPYTLL